jgi:hypothetical protein
MQFLAARRSILHTISTASLQLTNSYLYEYPRRITYLRYTLLCNARSHSLLYAVLKVFTLDQTRADFSIFPQSPADENTL